MGDLRTAVRALRTAPVVSAVAILSLALGIGANSAIFSILNTVLLRTLPVREPDRLVMLADGSWTNPIWEQIRGRSDVLFEGACAWGSDQFDLADGGQTDLVEGLWASGRLFDVLGVPPVLGRTFTAADDARGGGPDGPVAVIGYRFWQRHYGGAAGVIGQSITLNRLPFTIIGVTPPGFFGPEVGREFDVAIPIGTEPLLRGAESMLENKGYWWLDIMARLKPGQSVETATAALRGVQPQIRAATLPTDWRPEWLENYLKEAFTLVPAAGGDSFLRRRYERPLLALMGIVALVLLVACANIANLLLARAAARRHELSVRLALGASRMRLARQLLGESLFLAAAGAALGLLFARWGSALLVGQLSTASRPLFLDLSLDWRVLGFTSAVAVATALLFGTVPAFRAARTEPSAALKDQSRGVTGERRMGPGQILVVTQVALSLVLVVGAGLFVRTFISLVNRDLGFEKTGVLIVNVNAAKTDAEPAARGGLFERVREAVATLPGVTGAATSMVTPVSGSTWMYTVEVEGEQAPPERERGTHVNMISPGWFAVYHTRLLAGRDFDEGDRDGAPAVAIVNEAFARRFLHGTNPIGRTILRPSRPGHVQPPLEVIGLVADAVYRSLRDPVPPTMYVPLAQTPDLRPEVNISVREAAGSPSRPARAVADAIAGVDRNLSLTFRTLSDQVNASLTQDRLVALLSGFFGGLALLLAALGLYGVTAYAVSRRRTEIGVRLALGANPAGIVRLVLSRVTWLVGLGIASGLVISLWLSRLAGSLLWGLEPGDPMTFSAAVIVLAAVGALAGWWPARRASRIDAARVLREG